MAILTWVDYDFFVSGMFELTVHDVNYKHLFLINEWHLEVSHRFNIFCVNYRCENICCYIARFLALSNNPVARKWRIPRLKDTGGIIQIFWPLCSWNYKATELKAQLHSPIFQDALNPWRQSNLWYRQFCFYDYLKPWLNLALAGFEKSLANWKHSNTWRTQNIYALSKIVGRVVAMDKVGR